ncbi:MAG: sulfite reductase flavoprotein subunit alpha [Nannocystaceae bacterium]
MACPVYILFGTETGNAQDAAERLGDELADAGVPNEVLDMADYDHRLLADEQVLLVVTSTYGNGDPPANGRDFLELLHRDDAPKLGHVAFSVLGLGDRMHRHFCKCGIDFDRRLEELGGRRLAERVDCDTDYDEPFERWMGGLVPTVVKLHRGDAVNVATIDADTTTSEGQQRGTVNAALLRPATFVTVARTLNLNTPDSAKHTRHVELAIEGPNFAYEAGDRLAVWPSNDPVVVDGLLADLGLAADSPVVDWQGQAGQPLRDVLLRSCELGSSIQRPATRLHARGLVPQALVATFDPLIPRLYSICSSPVAHPGQVHLTVDFLRHPHDGGMREGVASSFLAARAPVGTRVSAQIRAAPHFRLPADDASIIMVGPGTGIAPFRGFLAERAHRGARGRNWLFFGSRHEQSDFLYREEIERYQADGVLTRLTTAFSRDHQPRLYVQHRMWEQRKELTRWLDAGAHVYICGDARRMALDVEKVLGAIVAAGQAGGDGGSARVTALRRAGRYHLDVY